MPIPLIELEAPRIPSSVYMFPALEAIPSRTHHTPFNNCQIFVIGSFYKILEKSKEKQWQLIKSAHKRVGYKCMLLIDIQKKYESQVDELFPELYRKFKQPYHSTNGSSMIMYLVVLTNLIPIWDREYDDKTK